jgi:hypothetical protein
MVETDRREVQIYQLRAVLSTSEVYVQYFSNFCPLAHTRATAGGFLCRDSTVLRCRDGVFSRKPQCMMALIPEHIPRFWTSIADKGRFWTENADMFNAQLAVSHYFGRVPSC